MSDINKEKLLESYPIPITIDSTKKILKQMENCIFKINNSNGKGTGFFCYITNNNQSLPVIITTNHLINEKIIKEKKDIRVKFYDNKDEIKIKIDNNRKIYTSEEYDTTIIEIKPERDKVKKERFLELDENVFDDEPNLYNEDIYIIQFPIIYNEQKASVSYGKLKEIEQQNNIIHLCSTQPGSSGSPILNLKNNKIIGMHKESSINFNKGIFLKNPIKEYLDNINIIKIEEEENNNLIDFKNEINDEYSENKNNEFKNDPKNLKYKYDITSFNDGSYGGNDIFEVFISFKDNKEYVVSPNIKSYNLEIFQLLDNKKITSLKGHNTNISTVRYFINNKDNNEYLISGDIKEIVNIWDITNNYTIKYKINTKYNNSSCLLIFPNNFDKNYIITSTQETSYDNDKAATKIYSLNNGEFIKYINNSNNNKIWYLLSWYNKENKKYYIIQLAYTIIINNLLEDELYSELIYQPKECHFSGFIYNKDNNDYLCTSSRNGYINIWDLYNKTQFKVIETNSCLFHTIQWNSKYIIVADFFSKSFKIIDIENGNIIDIPGQHTKEVICIKKVIHPNYGESLLSASMDNTIKLWSL